MKNYKELLSQLPSKTAVFAAGRFNPPSTGHELIIKVVRKLASQRKADHFVFVSSANDAKKNPLDISKKMQYLGSMFPNTKFVPKELDAAASTLKKYKHVTMVVPADSVEYYKKLLKKVKLDNVEFVTAGTNCPDEDDKLLKLASKGNFTSFKTGLPTTVRELDGKRLMNDVRSGMGLEPIKEQINLVKDDLREQYFRGEIFNEGDIVECEESVYQIIKRGSNHLLLQDETGSKVSKWIQDVKTTEREFMLNETVSPDSVQIDIESKKTAALADLKAKQAKQIEDVKKRQAQETQMAVDNLKTQRNEAVESPVVDTSKKYNIAKSIMSLSDFRKSTSMEKDEKSIEANIDDALDGKAKPIVPPVNTVRRMKIKHHLGEGSYAHGFADPNAPSLKGKREDDEYHNEPKPKFKARSGLDRPHTVHIDGKPWKKFSNGHQANAAAKTLQSKGKNVAVIAHFSEETEEQQDTHKTQLKRFKDQAAGAKLTEAQYAGLEKEDKPGKKKTEMKGGTNSVTGDTVEGWKDEKQPVKESTEADTAKTLSYYQLLTRLKRAGLSKDLDKVMGEEVEDFNEEEFALQVEADMDALSEEEFLEAYDDEELAIIDDETGEELAYVEEEAGMDTPALMEVLSRHERLMAKARFRRSQQHRKVKEKIALKRLSTPEVANKRARRMAISSMKKRLLQGRNPQKVSVGEKERVERFIQQRKKIVDRLASRMVQRVRQVEKARLHHTKFTKPNNGVKY